jgi:hypothetical protein
MSQCGIFPKLCTKPQCPRANAVDNIDKSEVHEKGTDMDTAAAELLEHIKIFFAGTTTLLQRTAAFVSVGR